MMKMFKSGAVAAAIVAIVAAALPVLPALADSNVGTSVTVLSGNGPNPVVKAMWQSSTTDENVPVAPNVGFQATTPVVFWAVVTDPAGVNNISAVYADVYYPATGMVDGPPINGVAPTNGSLKFEVQLTRWTTDEPGQSLFDDANKAGLVTINSSSNVTDIQSELDESSANVYEGSFQFDNCELAGIYPVTAKAVNAQNVHGTLSNTFDWVAVTAVDFDFNAVQYGIVAIGVDKQIGGDYKWSTSGSGPASIENVGNTYLQMTVKQDDTGFGQTVIGGVTTWNVSYDARLGDGDTGFPNEGYVTYNPAAAKGGRATLAGASATTVPEILRLCALDKIDFSILVTKDSAPDHTYSGTMILGAAYNAGPPTNPNPIYTTPEYPPELLLPSDNQLLENAKSCKKESEK